MSAANTIRLIPDAKHGGNTLELSTVKGESHKITVSSGSYIDIAPEQANSNGWVVAGVSGPTSARPTNAQKTFVYIDTTLSAVIVSDGAGTWYNVLTGAAV